MQFDRHGEWLLVGCFDGSFALATSVPPPLTMHSLFVIPFLHIMCPDAIAVTADAPFALAAATPIGKRLCAASPAVMAAKGR